ncbi:MAG: hypothetical protein BWY44_01229 [Candidatus Omnitrophica bacterium ADurb.Bin292]|jgi:hypothetical protein|nr:MAG: hypothetical protein BWY44_01229 [Candidatus Omnitrophica bacterium ADurb.Bin292]
MTIYERLIDLKFGQGVPTLKLIKRYPKHTRQIQEIALMGIPEQRLKKTVRDKTLLKKIITLKKRYPLPRQKGKQRSWLSRLFST